MEFQLFHTTLSASLLLFIMAGGLGSARLLVTDHSPAQVYAGLLVGAVCTFGCITYGIHY